MNAGEPTAKRASPFDLEDTDLALFAPKKSPNRAAPPKEAVLAVAEATKFPSREGRRRVTPTPEPLPAVEAVPVVRGRRLYRTGRNVQFNIRASQEVVNAFYDITDQEGWVLGETLENAVEALQRALKEGWQPSKK